MKPHIFCLRAKQNTGRSLHKQSCRSERDCPVLYCKFKNFCEGFIFEKLVKIKSLRIVQITIPFTDIGKSGPCCEFLTLQLCVFMLFCENKMLTKISEFTLNGG